MAKQKAKAIQYEAPKGRDKKFKVYTLRKGNVIDLATVTRS